eukprot:COSAG02_NODE_2575_length_8498_cov_9.569473_11_plen_40_part_00
MGFTVENYCSHGVMEDYWSTGTVPLRLRLRLRRPPLAFA